MKRFVEGADRGQSTPLPECLDDWIADPDNRSMAASGRGPGMVGYNMQIAVDTENRPIVAHEVINVGNDRSQLANMAEQAKAVQRRLVTRQSFPAMS